MEIQNTLKALWTKNMIAMATALDGECRMAGGAVRDALIGAKVNDFDFCTPFTPEMVTEMVKKAFGDHVSVIPTGIDHGTVTVRFNADDEQFEVTTLRRDMNTDGRHAEVEFITDYREDAARRDFTINAMMCDMHGNLYDWFGGYNDLITNPIVRFVGNAEDRIREDYLRIFRWFRFCARFSTRVEPGLIDVLWKNSAGLSRISRERIWAETRKLLSGNDPVAIQHMINRMVETGAATASGLFTECDSGYLKDKRVKNLIPNFVKYKTPETRLAYLWMIARKYVPVAARTDFTARILRGAETLKMSAPERDRMCWVNTRENFTVASAESSVILHGISHEWALEALEASEYSVPALNQRFAEWVPPVFPVSGNDLIAMGVQPGPEMGNAMRAMKAVWVATGFTMNREKLIQFGTTGTI